MGPLGDACPDRRDVVIPPVLHRTIPAIVSRTVEDYWTAFQEMHPGWVFKTWQEPLDPAVLPITSPLWDRCANGAQKAGLVRLELLVSYGGVYVDSDVEPVRSFRPLLETRAFAAWEDSNCIPDAVLGADKGHAAMRLALRAAMMGVERGEDAWHTGPGVTTAIFPGRDDMLVLPPGAFYPYHYLQKRTPDVNDGPWVFARHHWAGSWLTPAQRAANDSRQQ